MNFQTVLSATLCHSITADQTLSLHLLVGGDCFCGFIFLIVLWWKDKFLILLCLQKSSHLTLLTINLQTYRATLHTELEFLKRLWGLGTGEEEGYRTGPPGYIGWRNSFLGIDSAGPHTRLKIPALYIVHTLSRWSKSWWKRMPNCVNAHKRIWETHFCKNFGFCALFILCPGPSLYIL